ncbi:mannonate dehydratase [Vibrio lentus]|nr:mannonate dehydratase [Vibrio lentus]
MPICDANGLKMAVHPDDPPRVQFFRLASHRFNDRRHWIG